MALAGRLANVKITSTANAWSTGEAATMSTDGVTIRLDNNARRHWDRLSSTAPKVYRNSTLVASSDYSVNTVQGVITMDAAISTSDTYTIDALYKTATAVGGGREWVLNADASLLEVSEFSTAGWKQYIRMLSGASVTINRYWEDGTISDLMEVSDVAGDIVVELIPGSTGTTRYEGWGKISSDGINTPTDGVVGESIEIAIDGALYYSTST